MISFKNFSTKSYFLYFLVFSCFVNSSIYCVKRGGKKRKYLQRRPKKVPKRGKVNKRFAEKQKRQQAESVKKNSFKKSIDFPLEFSQEDHECIKPENFLFICLMVALGVTSFKVTRDSMRVLEENSVDSISLSEDHQMEFGYCFQDDFGQRFNVCTIEWDGDC